MSEQDTEGQARRMPGATGDDDTEGQGRRMPGATGDDDTEGQGRRMPGVSGDDDTEGVENLLDKQYINFASNLSAPVGSPFYVGLTDPRRVQIEFSARL